MNWRAENGLFRFKKLYEQRRLALLLRLPCTTQHQERRPQHRRPSCRYLNFLTYVGSAAHFTVAAFYRNGAKCIPNKRKQSSLTDTSLRSLKEARGGGGGGGGLESVRAGGDSMVFPFSD